MRTAIITLCLMSLTGVIQAQNKQSAPKQKPKPQSIESQIKAGRFAYEIHPWMGPKKLQTLLGKSLVPGK